MGSIVEEWLQIQWIWYGSLKSFLIPLKGTQDWHFFGFDFKFCTVSLLVMLKYEGFVKHIFWLATTGGGKIIPCSLKTTGNKNYFQPRPKFFFNLKGHGNETDFLGFLQKLVPHKSLTLTFEPFRFWLQIRGDIRIRKMTPRYHPYRLRVSVIRGVANSPHHWYAEAPTLPITETQSRRLHASPMRRVVYWICSKKTLRIDDTESRQLPAPEIRWVADSPYHWVGELPTPLITNTESRWLRISLSRGIDDSADRWYGESLFKEKINLLSIFRALNS